MAAPKGNKNAAKAKVWSDAVRLEAMKTGKIQKAAQKLVDMAVAGDMAAIKELGDRLEGKAVQAIAGDPDQPFVTKIIQEIVDGASDKGSA